MNELQYTWQGEKNRALALQRPCPCGCDARGGLKGVGYLTASDSKGNGFTVWITEEDVYQAVAKSFRLKAKKDAKEKSQ